MPLDRDSSKLFVAVSGSIAAGKTTLCNELHALTGLPLKAERVDNNPFLAKFYEEPHEYSFRLQVSFLGSRIKQHYAITRSADGAIQDRTLYEDVVFARVQGELGHMSADEMGVYTDIFEAITLGLPRPDLLLFLDVPADECLARIKQRCALRRAERACARTHTHAEAAISSRTSRGDTCNSCTSSTRCSSPTWPPKSPCFASTGASTAIRRTCGSSTCCRSTTATKHRAR
jgi:deoxyadenosine/deoxycytidine kinase